MIYCLFCGRTFSCWLLWSLSMVISPFFTFFVGVPSTAQVLPLFPAEPLANPTFPPSPAERIVLGECTSFYCLQQ